MCNINKPSRCQDCDRRVHIKEETAHFCGLSKERLDDKAFWSGRIMNPNCSLYGRGAGSRIDVVPQHKKSAD